MTASDLDLKYGPLAAGEFAGSQVLTVEERAQVQERQFSEGYLAAALGRSVGSHEPAAVKAGARHCLATQAMQAAIAYRKEVMETAWLDWTDPNYD